MSLQLKICSEDCGTWSVHGLSSLPVKHLPSLSASIDYARQECAAAPATIELLIVLPHRGMFPRLQALPHQACSRCLTISGRAAAPFPDF